MAALLCSTLLAHSSSWHPLKPTASVNSNHPPLRQNPPTKPPQAALLSPSRTFTATALVAAGFSLASALAFPEFASAFQFSLQEPPNALSLPTWAIHVSSVVEWVTAMGLVWQYGERPGYESWKGLSWGMVPLLGGALCACTWHFFYNSESLDILVSLQAALTVLGNFTMCIAAFRIYRATQGGSKNL